MTHLALLAALFLQTAQPSVTPSDLEGVWDVALDYDPGAPPSATVMEITTAGEDGSLEGSFYGTVFETARFVARDGFVAFTFVTSDNSGPYLHSGRLFPDGHIVGQTLSTGRDFLMPWTAQRQGEAVTGDEEATLAVLATDQMTAYVMDHDDASIRELAHPDYLLVLAPGVLESLDMVDGTSTNVELTRWDQSVLDTRIVGDTGIVTVRVDAAGIVSGRPFPERLIISHVFVREGEGADWQLLHRTMTPIIVPEDFYEDITGRALGWAAED